MIELLIVWSVLIAGLVGTMTFAAIIGATDPAASQPIPAPSEDFSAIPVKTHRSRILSPVHYYIDAIVDALRFRSV